MAILCGEDRYCEVSRPPVSYSPYPASHIPKGGCTMAKITVQGYRCERCQHEWVPRRSSTSAPRTCPKCKSPYWDRPRTVVKT